MVFAHSISDDKNYCDVTQVDLNPRLPVGTRLEKADFSVYHYARAGEDLQPEVFVEPGLSDAGTGAGGQDFVLATLKKFADIIYGKVVATIGDPRDKPGILGWSVVEVKKGYYFWIREVPIRAALVKGDEPGGGT